MLYSLLPQVREAVARKKAFVGLAKRIEFVTILSLISNLPTEFRTVKAIGRQYKPTHGVSKQY